MSLIRLNIGTEIDIASGPEVAALQDTVTSGLDRLSARIPQAVRANRRRLPASANLATPATGTFVLDFGRPTGGNLWWVGEVIVTAADDRTAPAGTVAALYAGNPPGQQGAALFGMPALGSLVRPAIAVPAVFSFQENSVAVHDGENLFVVVYSPTTVMSVLSAVATVQEQNASAVSLNRG